MLRHPPVRAVRMLMYVTNMSQPHSRKDYRTDVARSHGTTVESTPKYRNQINTVGKVKQSRYTPWRRLGGEDIAPTLSRPRL